MDAELWILHRSKRRPWPHLQVEFPHVLDISVLYTCNLHLLFVSYYKIVMYLSNQSKDQALSAKMVMAEIKSKLKIIILKYRICMHKLSFFMYVRKVDTISAAIRIYFLKIFYLKSLLATALNKWWHTSTLHTHQIYTKIAKQHAASVLQYKIFQQNWTKQV